MTYDPGGKNDRENPEVPRLRMLREGRIGDVSPKLRMNSVAPT